MYVAAMATYWAVSIFHSMQPPRFWAHTGLAVIVISVLVSSWVGSHALLIDGLILGGWLSLVWCYILERLTWAYCAQTIQV